MTPSPFPWAALMWIALALLLTACGTAPTVVTQQVDMPIPIYPIAAADLPERPADTFAATAPAEPLDTQVQALLIDRETTAAYTARLRALVGACIGPATARLGAQPTKLTAP